MIASIVFAIFAILVSISYVGAVVVNHYYQVIRDFICWSLAIFIYCYGWTRLNVAIHKLEECAKNLDMTFNTKCKK